MLRCNKQCLRPHYDALSAIAQEGKGCYAATSNINSGHIMMHYLLELRRARDATLQQAMLTQATL